VHRDGTDSVADKVQRLGGGRRGAVIPSLRIPPLSRPVNLIGRADVTRFLRNPVPARWAGGAEGPIFRGMGSGAWKGAGLGAILFLVIAAVGALTPLRVPLLKIAGRDYPALQLQKEAAQAAVSSRAPVSGPDALTRERVDVRLEAWHKRNATLSVFGLLGWLMEMRSEERRVGTEGSTREGRYE